MHPNVTRVVAAASESGLEITVERFPQGTRTAADAARAVGCDVAQIVKSLVFMTAEAPVLALVSGSNRVDLRRLEQELGVAQVRRANGDEARAATGYAIGGVPPFGHAADGHAAQLTVLVDADLLSHDQVWAAAGLPDAVFPIRPDELVRLSRGRVADLAERSTG